MPNVKLRDSLRAIANRHQRGAGGISIALALTQTLDSLIRQTYESFSFEPQSSPCLIALGGYGRKELCFASDTDIMFLIPSEDTTGEAAMAVQKLLHKLLDLGLDIGHSTRTIEHCLELRKSDIESWVSLVESRYLCGNKKLFREFRTRLDGQIEQSDHIVFVQDLVNRTELRHKKYGNSTKLLEPNIKNSAGGLRDLHAVLWLFRGSGKIRIPTKLPKNATAVTALFHAPAIRRQFTPQQILQTRKAMDFLLRTRNEMHLQSKSLHDSLEFAFQRSVAESLSFPSSPTRSNVERFMQSYYVASRQIAQFARRATRIVHRTRPTFPPAKAVKLDQCFVLKSENIFPRSAKVRISNEILLAACLHSLAHSAGFSDDLEDLISRQLQKLTTLKSDTETALFRKILNHPRGVGDLLQRLGEYRVLERWLPEWKSMVAFFQHNQYHYYTADEHTFRVIQNAEALATSPTTFGLAFRLLPRRDTLYLACLLHDIAKPKRVGDHEVTGAAMTKKVLARLRMGDIASDVRFLVRNHLLMEQVAFRRNLNDPQTIINFAAKFRSPHLLEYLYVLTYADLSAVNKNVWTDWKGMLLYELYHKSGEILERSLSSEEVHLAAREQHTEAVNELVRSLAGDISQDSSRTHLEAVDSPDYLATFDATEVAEHIRHIERNEPVATIFRDLQDVTEVTVITKDAPFLLSKCCGVLSANDANILDAHVFTRTDGVVIDKFRVLDFISRTILNQGQRGKIHKELNDVVGDRVDIEKLLERHRMKWRRLTSFHNPNSRLAIEFEDHPRFTIIDIFAPDRLGVLYKITETISTLNLNISFAKIATRADGIVDSFYILDRNGTKIDSPARKEAIRAALLQTIHAVSESELVSSS